MTLEEWQTELRRQFGREQKFRIENVGNHPVFSQFRVTNPSSGSTYQVRIRGEKAGENSCTCPDYATNALGTCKHVEFVLSRIAKGASGKAALRAGYRPSSSEIILKYGAPREVRFAGGTDCPPELLKFVSRFFDSQGVLRPERFSRFEQFLAETARYQHSVEVNDDALAFVAEVRDAEERRRRIDEAYPRGIRSTAFKKLLKTSLYDYQREGALFAARSGRSLIGDEMGLGKTVQAIAAAEIMARHLNVSRVLVVCPTSLKHQWEREVARFTDRAACVIGGSLTRRRELYGADSFFKIVNYDTVHRDLDSIREWSPELVVLDEAQRIKNWNTRTARSVKKLVSPYAIVLTGTPLENRLEDLVSIVEFVDLHRLGPTFKFLAQHQTRDEHGRVVGYRDLDSIGRTLAPILIRRRKSEVAQQLPSRIDKNFFVPMTPEQLAHHEENREIVARIVARWRQTRFLSEADQRRLMVALQNMRMSCDSTYLLDQNTDHGVKADEFATLLDELCEEPETKVVVFSQWVRMHELLQRRLKLRGDGYVLFHGGVPGDKRGELIQRFREDDACRVFLSTDAGGVGLNLQHASVVINVDLPWNPAVLEQRIGRVHRLGQKRPVQVFNLISQGTIEEGMLSVLSFKRSLFTGALDGGQSEVFLGGSRLTRFMETVEKTAGAIPSAVLSTDDTAGAENVTEAQADVHDAAKPVSAKASPPSGKDHAERSLAAWQGLLQTGMTFLRNLAVAAKAIEGSRESLPGNGWSDGHRSESSLVRRDAVSGEPYLHLPVPNSDVLERVLAAAEELLGNLRPR